MSAEPFRGGRRRALWTARGPVDDGGGTVGGGQAEGDQAESRPGRRGSGRERIRPKGSGRSGSDGRDQAGADQTGADQTGADQTGADQAEAAAALVDPEVPLEDAAVLAGADVLDVLEESFEDPAESDDFELDSEDLPFVLARLSLR
jgi:hypothetical protein